MPLIYVTMDDVSIVRQGYGFALKSNGKKFAHIPQGIVDQFMIGPNVEIAPKTLAAINTLGIPTAFLDQNGIIRSRLVPSFSSNVHARIAQAIAWENIDMRLKLAKVFVAAKLANQAHSIALYEKNNVDNVFKITRKFILSLGEKLSQADSVNEVLGVEGIAAVAYWKAFGAMIKNKNFTWTGRKKHPSLDPVNAMLSYGYAILSNIVHSYLELSDLDPYVGYLHSTDSRKMSFAYDIIEPYRALFVDKLVIRMINLSMVSKDDFYQDGGNGIFMVDNARKLLVKEICGSINSCDEELSMNSVQKLILEDIEKFNNLAKERSLGNFMPYVADIDSKIIKCLNHL